MSKRLSRLSEGSHVAGRLLGARASDSHTFLLPPPTVNALASLLHDWGKDLQAEAVIRGGLTRLNLQHRQICDAGAEIVAWFLKSDENVIGVCIYNCSIGLHGIEFIAEALEHNKTVESLSMTNNQIQDIGAELLIAALNQNVCLKELSVWSNDAEINPELESTIEYLTKTRNRLLIPAAVRRASLYLVASRCILTGAGDLAIFPKEIVKMIAMQVWATRKDPIWIEALSESERTGKLGQ